jgi:hypothetical protein
MYLLRLLEFLALRLMAISRCLLAAFKAEQSTRTLKDRSLVIFGNNICHRWVEMADKETYISGCITSLHGVVKHLHIAQRSV